MSAIAAIEKLRAALIGAHQLVILNERCRYRE
jgi:hypothetical protein